MKPFITPREHACYQRASTLAEATPYTYVALFWLFAHNASLGDEVIERCVRDAAAAGEPMRGVYTRLEALKRGANA